MSSPPAALASAESADDDPSSVSALSSSSALRFQKTRIVALNESLAKLTSSYAELKERYVALQRRDDEREEATRRKEKEWSKDRDERDRKARDLDIARADVERLTRELNAARKERADDATRRRDDEREERTRDAKTKALLADNDRLRKRVDALEGTAKAGSEAHSDGEELAALRRERARLLSQRGEMVAAFKKAMRLIDVLKRQKMHLEAAKLLSFTEAEFTAAIDVADA